MTPERMLLDGHGTPTQRFYALRAVMKPEHHRMLRSLPYPHFLRTPYWRIVSRYVRLERGACECCGAQSHLQAHHRTYEHRGDEVNHLTDLEVLCRQCHERRHGITTAPGEWQGIRELVPEAMRRLGMLMEVA